MHDKPKQKFANTSQTEIGGRNEFQPVSHSDLDHELFDKNLTAWIARFPEIATKLKLQKPIKTNLVIDKGNDYDLEIDGQLLIGQGSRSWASQSHLNFASATRLNLGYGYPLSNNDNSFFEKTNIVPAILHEAERNDIQFGQIPNDLKCHHLVVLGTGLGHHIPILTQTTECKSLILVEPNYEQLFFSLYTYEWHKLFESFNGKEKKIFFLTSATLSSATEIIRKWIFSNAPHLIEGMHVINTFQNSFLDKLSTAVIGTTQASLGCMGFFEDECDMIRNAYLNMKNFEGRHWRKPDQVIPIPVFIIGSGPSLDECIDIIKQNQNGAAIISCGTALRVLLKNGIKPDFHVEMENTPEIVDLIAAEAQHYDLSSVTLVVANTVTPGITKYFAHAVMYVREGVASTPLLLSGKESVIEYALPTVANLGLSFAQEFGFRDIYSFGIDLGTRDIERHHARDSSYFDADSAPYEDVLDIPLEANFGGDDIWSDNVFVFSKSNLEQAISRALDERNYFNCSDGVRIDGMVPLSPMEVNVPEFPSKTTLIEKAVSELPEQMEIDFEQIWDKSQRIKAVLTLRDNLIESLEETSPSLEATKQKMMADLSGPVGGMFAANLKAAGQFEPEFFFMDRVKETLLTEDTAVTMEQHLLMGTVIYNMRALRHFTCRLPVTELRRRFIKFGRQELMREIEWMSNHITEVFKSLDQN